ELGPAWQQTPGDEGVRLPPALVALPGVLLDVALGHLLERPPTTQREAIRVRICALGDLIQDLARQLSRVGERNGAGVADRIPARSASADRVHAFPGAVARRLDRQC